MKMSIQMTIELDDKYVETWNERSVSYYTLLYKSEELGLQALEENPITKAIADEIEDYVENMHGVTKCEIL